MPRTNRPLLDAIAAVAAGQLGLVSAEQFEQLGMAASTLQWRIRQGGPWSRVLPGVYLLGTGQLTAEQSILAAWLYTKAPSALTGFTALRLHGIRAAARDPREEVHLIVPASRKRISHRFVHVERCSRWPVTTVIDGYDVAPPARAAIDACRRLDDKHTVRALLTEVVTSGLATREDMGRELAQSQRRRSALAREALALMAAGPASAPELDLLERWRAAGLPDAEWNADLHLPDGRFLARPDVYVAEYGIAVEVDSLQFHYSRPDWEMTMQRHARMTSHGLLVLHFTPARIRAEWAVVLREIQQAIDSQAGQRPPAVTSRPHAA
jgi:hypothetical protein